MCDCDRAVLWCVIKKIVHLFSHSSFLVLIYKPTKETTHDHKHLIPPNNLWLNLKHTTKPIKYHLIFFRKRI